MNKDKMFLLLAVVSVLMFGIPATLHAGATSPAKTYIGADFLGHAWLDGNMKYTGQSIMPGSTNVDGGFLFGLNIGSDILTAFDSWPVRAEAEYFYRKHDISNRSSVQFDDLKAHSIFVNIYIEQRMPKDLILYLGGGSGMTQVKVKTQIPSEGREEVNDFISGYQFLLGVDKNMPHKNLRLGLKARYVKNRESLSESLPIGNVRIDNLDFWGLSLNVKFFGP